jgi:hypothetical protein
MKFHSILFVLLFAHTLQAKTAPVNVYIVSDRFEMTKIEFQTMATTILNSKEIKVSKFDVFQSCMDQRFPDSWLLNKVSVNYYPNKLDCNYEACVMLSNFIKDKSTEKTKLFYGEGEFKCNIQSFGIESAPFTSTANGILSKITDEIQINKSLGKELTLVFYMPASKSITAPSVTFDLATLEIKKGESVQLKPSSVDNSLKYSWQPATGLKDVNTAITSAQPLETTDYTLTAENSLGCKSAPATVKVVVAKTCTDNYAKCEILYTIDDHLYQTVLGDATRWKMASTQPGSLRYYLVCNPNCGEAFTVTLLNTSGGIVWEKEYTRKQVESGQKLHKDHKGKFIFIVDLESLSNFETLPFYKFRIATKDEDGNVYPTYTSPLTKFVDCGFAE